MQIGEHELDVCEFDKAYAAYKKAAEIDPTEPEAYFGMALADFKVQYIKDEVNNRLQPICHEITEKKIVEDGNFKLAFKHATDDQRREYVNRAKEIDYIGGEFYRLAQSGLDYDCFICVKVTDDATGYRTSDYNDADNIYFALKGEGYKPFFSERELAGFTGADYEARILYALYKSECMIIVCGDESYLKTPWVKNEYTRFLKLVNDEEKESDSITVAFRARPIERLEGKRGKIQGVDLKSLNALQRILSFVQTHTPENRARREALATGAVATAPKTGATTDSLIRRAKLEAESGDYSAAASYYERALDIDPLCAEAWFGAYLSEMTVADGDDIVFSDVALDRTVNSKNYKRAVKYARADSEVKRFESIVKNKAEKRRDALKAENGRLFSQKEALEKGLSVNRAQLEEITTRQSRYGGKPSSLSAKDEKWGCFIAAALLIPFIGMPLLIIKIVAKAFREAGKTKYESNEAKKSQLRADVDYAEDEIRRLKNSIEKNQFLIDEFSVYLDSSV